MLSLSGCVVQTRAAHARQLQEIYDLGQAHGVIMCADARFQCAMDLSSAKIDALEAYQRGLMEGMSK